MSVTTAGHMMGKYAQLASGEWVYAFTALEGATEVEIRSSTGVLGKYTQLANGEWVYATVLLDANGNAVNTDSLDPLTTIDVSDDFISGLTTTGNIGNLGWSFTGTSAVSANSLSANHPGVIRLTSTATLNTLTALYPRVTAGTGIATFSAPFDMTWVAALVQVDANTQSRLGASIDPSSQTPANAAYFERLGPDTNWFAVTRATSVETRTDTGIAADTSYHKFRIRRISAGNYGFTIDANAEIVVTSNAPTTGNWQPFAQMYNLEAAAKAIEIDFFQLRITGIVR